MKSIILLFGIFLINLTVLAGEFPDDSCKKNLSGWFTVQGNEHIKVRRTLKRQIEKNTETGIWYRYKIRWTGPCSYDLILAGTNDKSRIIKDQLRDKAHMPHQILEISNEGFTYKTEFIFMSADNCGTLRRFVRKTETLIRVE